MRVSRTGGKKTIAFPLIGIKKKRNSEFRIVIIDMLYTEVLEFSDTLFLFD
jgi:hypothetical protein